MVLLCVAACGGGSSRTDWQARIGHASLDEVSRDLGPPESCVALDDGGSACSWRRSASKDVISKLIFTFDERNRLATVNEVRF
jgi:hypothetical protein